MLVFQRGNDFFKYCHNVKTNILYLCMLDSFLYLINDEDFLIGRIKYVKTMAEGHPFFEEQMLNASNEWRTKTRLFGLREYPEWWHPILKLLAENKTLDDVDVEIVYE